MKILLVIAAAVTVVVLSGGYYVFMKACHREKEVLWDDPAALEQTNWAPLADKIQAAARYLEENNVRDIYVQSYDGLKLRAR